jgi:hypothetical protein
MTRVAYSFVALLVLAVLLLLNIRAHAPGNLETTIAQLRFLDDRLEAGGASDMQQLFPEGYVFTWALYGLASAQVARQLEESDPRRIEFVERARRADRHVQSDQARSTFEPDLDPPFGAYYNSWSLFLRTEYLRAAKPDRVEEQLLADLENQSRQFADALQRSESPFLPSYRDAAWPADTVVGVAALGIRDQILPPRYQTAIEQWLEKARARVDPHYGVLPFAAPNGVSDAEGGVRGSSLALMARVLVDVSPAFARQHYTVLRDHFIEYRWGIPGVREYPRGQNGAADIDSGPLLLGFSGPAVVVGAAAARVHGDESIASYLQSAVEVGGLPYQWNGRRRYGFGFVPVGDAFIAWARSSPRPHAMNDASWPTLLPRWWPVPAHLLSAVLAGCVMLPFLARRPRGSMRH